VYSPDVNHKPRTGRHSRPPDIAAIAVLTEKLNMLGCKPLEVVDRVRNKLWMIGGPTTKPRLGKPPEKGSVMITDFFNTGIIVLMVVLVALPALLAVARTVQQRTARRR